MPPADIVFVVDYSGSIGSRLARALSHFVASLVTELDPDSRVGLIVFSSTEKPAFQVSAQTVI